MQVDVDKQTQFVKINISGTTAQNCDVEHINRYAKISSGDSGGDIWMVDCGEGTQVQLQKSTIKLSRISKIFLTHLHGDHIFGLPGLFCTLSTLTAERMDFTLEVYGPLGIAKYIRESLNLSRSPLSFRYKVYELIPLNSQYPGNMRSEWPVLEADNSLHPQESATVKLSPMAGENPVWNVIENHIECTVQASRIEHRIPCFGFVFNEKNKSGTLDAEYLKKKGIPPGPQYAKLKRGESITLPSGETISPEDCVGPDKKGKKITVLGDTNNPFHMLQIAKNSDVLIHEATLEDQYQEKAITNGHSTPSMAAEFSYRISAATLILNHYSQRYRPPGLQESKLINQEPSSVTTDLLLHEAKSAVDKFPSFKCDVVASRDLLQYTVK